MNPPEALVPVPEVEPGTAGPPCAYARLRTERPVVKAQLPNGETGWLISRYDDVRAAFADPRLVRPLLSAWPPREGADAPPPCLPTFLEMTGAHHERVRRTVLPMFGRKRLEFMEPRIRTMAGELIDAMVAGSEDGTADLVAAYADPLPLRVLCETTGLPYEDRDVYLPHTLALLGAAGLTMEEVLAALYALQDYAEELISRKEKDTDGEDYIRLLLAEAGRPGSELTRDDVVSFVVTMLMAGYKTNIQHTGNALLALLTHPEQLRTLREAPERIGTAVEELLRYVPLMNAINILVAKEDLTLHGQHIRAGDAVVPVPASANRDPEAFADPDRLDLTRTPNAHVAFGHGPHACTGGHLTRMQLTILIEVLLERLPGIELAVPADTIPWDESTPLRAPARLPVRW
ncbi:cytochrome P450 family protein [Streptomyces albireticuli]|uniref:Cytochrome n=1 Tax=Streptomyces albireticuli TaxID=1940 RepID=A0A2A2D0H8_9ACTN|nr:cytochrome P450 [Streptomyces albireticuli]MCD9144911.1 cytochrome P450 [Streptomyces albireticuli]MCD9164337.1 cytochrome P450 [Streptomyces albireticuli]MCD9194048.1 cytochrome P450 [Streptomyces albireticuli]PAU45943.1 cytochrome [Streptomyces albireticuli]